jgi:hypothetical protein
MSPGYEKGSAPASLHGGLQALGDYYGRLLAWYTRGGFVDELGVKHTSGHHLNITVWEIFNEPDYEHGHSVETYTLEFDPSWRASDAMLIPSGGSNSWA